MIHNICKASIFISLLYSIVAWGQEQKARPKMTVFCYMVGDVLLEDALRFNCQQLELGDVSRDMHVFFYIVRTRKGEPIDYIDGTVRGQETQTIKKPMRGLGHGGLLLQGLRRALQDKSDYLSVVIAHSSGEETQIAQRSFIPTPSVIEAFKNYLAESKKPVDLLILDAGLTATDQMIRIFSPYTRFMLASQSPERIFGLPYHFLIKAFKEGNHEPSRLGCALVKKYKYYYEALTNKYSATLFDVQALAPLSDTLQSIRNTFVQALKQAKLLPYTAHNHFDLKDALQQLLVARKHKNTPQDNVFKQGMAKALALIKAGTLCHVKGHLKGNGLSVFVPHVKPPPAGKKR